MIFQSQGKKALNWRKFLGECGEFQDWLGQIGANEQERVLLNTLTLAGRGLGTAEQIAEAALGMPSVAAAAMAEKLSGRGDVCLPSRIKELMQKWLFQLPDDPWFIGEVFERLSGGRRRQGQFYTAPEIIDFILSHTVELADVTANPYLKVLDPACGSGYFLLKAYDVLRRKYCRDREVLAAEYSDLDWSEAGIHRHIISNNLWGADISPMAVELTAAGLLGKNPGNSHGLVPRLRVGDSLIRPEGDCAGQELAFWANDYNYVIGNPPYVSFGLRGAGRLAAEYEQYLRQAYTHSAEYKISYYALFMQRGIELLCPGGRLGFIVPDSFLLGRFYSKIRRYILNETLIEVIAHIAAPVFKQAVVGMSAICILTKNSGCKARSDQAVRIYQAAETAGLKPDNSYIAYKQDYYETIKFNRFRIFHDLTVKTLIDKIDNDSLPLVNFATGHSGIRSRTKQSDIIADARGRGDWRPGLVSGSQIHRYRLDYQGHWLNIDPQMLYKGGWDTSIISRRKILLRQTGFTLTACIDIDGFYHLNNIHCFITTKKDVFPEFLLMLFNSRLFAFYYHAVTLEYGRAMAQTDIETLEALPVRFDREINRRAPALVASMQNMMARHIAGKGDLSRNINMLNDLLDKMIYRLYDLSDSEIACIERFEAGLARRRKK